MVFISISMQYANDVLECEGGYYHTAHISYGS